VVQPVKRPRGVLNLKRSNRLILLIGFVLAIGAFAGIFFVLSNGTTKPPPETSSFVVAAVDIPIGTTISKDMLTTSTVPKGTQPADSFGVVEQVVGKVARTVINKDAYISKDSFSSTSSQSDIAGLLPTGYRALPVRVDQVNGVGTLIQPGDHVDVVVTMGGASFPVVTTDPTTKALTVVTGVNTTSVKDVIQNVQVVATLASLSSAPAASGSGSGSGAAAPANGTVASAESVQIVVLAVTAQQAEVLRFSEIDGTADQSGTPTVTLLLRSTQDKDLPPDDTTGITLRQLVDHWAVLPPQIVETVLPQ
jgi:Flp pilus assembly protein CpaB